MPTTNLSFTQAQIQALPTQDPKALGGLFQVADLTSLNDGESVIIRGESTAATQDAMEHFWFYVSEDTNGSINMGSNPGINDIGLWAASSQTKWYMNYPTWKNQYFVTNVDNNHLDWTITYTKVSGNNFTVDFTLKLQSDRVNGEHGTGTDAHVYSQRTLSTDIINNYLNIAFYSSGPSYNNPANGSYDAITLTVETPGEGGGDGGESGASGDPFITPMFE